LLKLLGRGLGEKCGYSAANLPIAARLGGEMAGIQQNCPNSTGTGKHITYAWVTWKHSAGRARTPIYSIQTY
jgi:hypothetical protein